MAAATTAAVLWAGAPAQAADERPCAAPADEPGVGPVQTCPLVMPDRGHVPVHGFRGTVPVEVGRLNRAGTENWFVCQTDRPDGVFPDRYVDPDHPDDANRFWAKTLSDGPGGAWGWVNEIHLSGGFDDEPDSGLRFCGPQDLPAPPPAPPAAAIGLEAGLLCTPVGQAVPVKLTVRRRAGRARAEVLKVVFVIRKGGFRRRTDKRAPYRAKLPVQLAPGTRGRVAARVYFRRAGSGDVRRRTVSRRFHVCAA